MPVPQSELRDELAVLIAAGRELTPDHDQALAEVFIERMERSMPRPSRFEQVRGVWEHPRRVLGAVILGFACLGTASVLTIHARSSAPVQPPAAKVPAMPLGGKMPVMPLGGKVPVVPPAPKVPLAPQPPAPKSAP